MNAIVRTSVVMILGTLTLSLSCANDRDSGALAEYDQLITASKRCNPDDRCVVAGGIKGCRCSTAVRSEAQARVEGAAQGAVCPAIERLYCPPLKDPRCDAGICVATPVPE
jgi:hypothetical protein